MTQRGCFGCLLVGLQISQLNAAVETHFTKLVSVRPGMQYFRRYDPDFVMQCVNEYLAHIGREPPLDGYANAL